MGWNLRATESHWEDSYFLFFTKFQQFKLEIWIFKSLKVRRTVVQTDVVCTIYICSGVAKGYSGKGQALEMNRIVGETFEVDCKGGRLAKVTAKKQNKKQKQRYTTNKQKGFNLLVA